MKSFSAGKIFGKAKSIKGNPVDIVITFKEFYSLYKEHEQTQRDLKKYEEMKEVLITEMNMRHQLVHDAMDRVFSERKETISKFFIIIEKGLSENNTDYVLAGLKGVSEIVSKSPFKDLQQLGEMLNAGKRIEI